MVLPSSAARMERIRRDMRGRGMLVFEGMVQQGESGATVIAEAVQPGAV